MSGDIIATLIWRTDPPAVRIGGSNTATPTRTVAIRRIVVLTPRGGILAALPMNPRPRRPSKPPALWGPAVGERQCFNEDKIAA